MDSSVYVRERGSLRRMTLSWHNQSIILAQPKPATSCRRTNPLVLRKEHFIFTYNEEGSLRYTTKSLFDITLLFVANNIQHVDSLVGFPEQIGDKLFAAAEENRVFLNPDVSPKALKLFTDAYGENVLGSLCLRNRFPLLHERIDEIKMFHSLKSLDLFGCRLGDYHEIFQHLTSTPLANSLIQLFLGGNHLSDVALQRLTLPLRMMQKKLDCLQLLDISYNPISERALRYLKCFPKLLKLDASATNMKLDAGLRTTVWNLLGLIHSDRPLETFDHSGCKTEGWAEQVVNQWETSGLQVPKQKRVEELRASALGFFGRQRFIRDAMNTAPLTGEQLTESNAEKLHFCKPVTNDFTKETPVPSARNHQVPSSCCNVNKRKGKSSKDGTSHHSPPSKRSISSGFTEEDLDLLSSY
ncbi:leucine-rich repeat-containing protein 42 isoform X1 [Nothobranchius furzeri]|uniref:Leucine rich repeat containing 42 n=2 Tax=Nothobranchius TaxID=28779 RepID=A0A1A8UPD1_NOTFU|nr:leucine-rich repeat-containing protein 42 isoform X1 [Nothobranchius furzeri]KAF7222155.1 transcript variant X1 [Nothobranchius furzeri]